VRKIIIGLIAAVLVSACAWVGCSQAADEAAPAAAPAPAPAAGGDAAAPAAGDAGACCKPDDQTPTLDLIKAVPKGGLHNPYKDKIAEIADAGHKKYMSAGCNGCHGGGGGGGMCPPLTNDTWVYGPDDDTLFRLIALGSDRLKAAGYHRVKQEVVVGPMPPFGGIFKTSDDLWRVITWTRSVNPSSATKPPLQ
jgi:mono/diheme cytochrome c family protein